MGQHTAIIIHHDETSELTVEDFIEIGVAIAEVTRTGLGHGTTREVVVHGHHVATAVETYSDEDSLMIIANGPEVAHSYNIKSRGGKGRRLEILEIVNRLLIPLRLVAREIGGP